MKKLFLLILLMPYSAWATTYYVSTTGSNSNNGTSTSTPFLTAQKCSDVSTAGDICYFRTGSYAGFTVTNSGSAGNVITFKNYNGEVVYLDASVGTVVGTSVQTDVINASNKNYLMFDGLRLTGNTATTSTHTGRAHVSFETTAGTFITLQNCWVSYAWGTGVGIYFEAHDITVQNCRIFQNAHDNYPRGAAPDRGDDWGAGMIAFHGDYNITFKGNYIYWNHGEGVTCSDHGHEVTFDGNVVADNWSVNLYAAEGCQNVTAKNNIVFTTSSAAAGESSTGTSAGCGNPANNPCNPDGITFTSGDSGSAYTFNQRDLTGLRIYNNAGVNLGRCLLRYNHESGHTDSDWVIANNTCALSDVNTSFTGASAISNWSIRNNIFTGDRRTGNISGAILSITPAPTSTTISHNIYNSTSAKWTWNGTDYTSLASWVAASGDSSSLQTDPQLVSISFTLPSLRTGTDAFDFSTFNNNLVPISTSPAVDSGTTLSSTFTTDLTGATRISGFWDRGAYEFNGTVVIAPACSFNQCETFDNYTVAASVNGLNSGAGWTGAWSCTSGTVTIQLAGPGGQGGNALHSLQGTDCTRTFTASTAQTFRFLMSLHQVSFAAPNANVGVLIGNASTGHVADVRHTGSTVDIYDGSMAAYVTLKDYGSVSAGEDRWITIDLEVDAANHANQFRARADLGTWSSWTNGENSFSTIDQVQIFNTATNAAILDVDGIGGAPSVTTSHTTNIFAPTVLR